MKTGANNNLNDIVLVRVVLPYTLGICAFYNLQQRGLLQACACGAALLFVYLLLNNLFYARWKRYRHKTLNGILVYLLLFLLGGLCCLLHRQSDCKNHFSKYPDAKYLRIRIDTEPQYKPRAVSFVAIVTDCWTDKRVKVSGKLMVYIRLEDGLFKGLEYGDELLIPANYKEPKSAQHDGQFDYRAWLAAKNIYQQAFVAPHSVQILAREKGNFLQAYAYRLREKQVAYYKRVIKSRDNEAFLSTLILGYKSELNEETVAMYASTGTIHALSVSGMHVGIVYVVLNWLLQVLNRGRLLQALKACLLLAFIWAYTLLTGLSPSALRAAIMISVFVISKAGSASSNAYNVFAFTAMCMLVANPFVIWDLGFQLSFLAVFGLIWLQPKIERWFVLRQSWLRYLWSAITMSLAAQIVTYPLSVYYFHQFPVFFLFSNLFILIPITLLMYLGIALLLLRLDFLTPLLEWVVDWMHAGLRTIAGLKGATVSGIWIDKTELLLLGLTGVTIISALSVYDKRLLKVGLTCALFTQVYHSSIKIRSARQQTTLRFDLPKTRVVAFIRSHKAILVAKKTPDRQTFAYSIKPVLDKHRIESTDWLMLSK